MTAYAEQFDSEQSTRISPARTGAISVALILHISAVALLMSPVRRVDFEAAPSLPALEVLMPERVREIQPPPLAPITPPRPQRMPVLAPRISAPPTPIADAAPIVFDTPELESATIESTPVSIDTNFGETFVPAQIGAASYLTAPPPRYPALSRKRGQEGIVLLLVGIGADGSSESVSVHQSSGYAMLDKAALDQVQRRWRFRPALIDGRPTRTRALVPVSFQLTHD